MDDIIVFSASVEEHLQHLSAVFERLRNAGLKLNAKKCQFAREEVPYLSYLISKHGLRTDPKKTKAVESFPIPTCGRELRSFPGLASYYRRFIQGFAKIAHPLHALLRKDTPFKWTPDCQEAFDELKNKLVTTPVLAYPDLTQTF